MKKKSSHVSRVREKLSTHGNTSTREHRAQRQGIDVWSMYTSSCAANNKVRGSYEIVQWMPVSQWLASVDDHKGPGGHAVKG